MSKETIYPKPTQEPVKLYTNEIDDTFFIDYKYFDSKFDFYIIKIEEAKAVDEKKEVTEANYRKKVMNISSELKKLEGVIASVHDKYNKCKIFMVKKNADISLLANKYNTETVNAVDLLDWNLHHLICNGMCTLKNITELDNFSYETRYYQIVNYKQWDDVTEIITVQVQIKSDWNIATSDRTGNKLPLILAPSTTTFTNIEAIKKSNNKKRKANLLAGEKYELNGSFMAPLKKGKDKTSSISSGVFVKGSLKKTKNRTSAYHVDHKSLASTDGMRANILFKYFDALNNVYGDAIKLKLKSYDFDINYSMKDLEEAKKLEYKKIIEVLQSHTIRIINKSATDISKDIKELIAKTLDKHNIIYDGEICQDDLVLVFVDSEEEYKKANTHDVYKEFKTNYPQAISQAIVMNAITDKVKSIIKLKFSTKNKNKISGVKQNNVKVINESAFEITDNLKKSISKKIDKKDVVYSNDIGQNDTVLIFINANTKDHEKHEEEIFNRFSNIDANNIILGTVQKEIEGTSVLEFILVQLFNKLEIAKGEFLIKRPDLPEYVWFIEPIRIKNDKPTSEDIEDETTEKDDNETNTSDDFLYYKGVFINGKFIITRLTNEEIDQIKQDMGTDADLFFGRKKNDGSLTKNRNSMAYFPKDKKYIIFTETDRSIIPNQEYINNEKKQLERGRKEKVGRKYLEDYSRNPIYREKPRKAIQKMLEDYPDVNAFGYNAVNQALKGLKGDNRYELPTLIFQGLKIKWLDRAQRTSGKDLINHQYGFNFSDDNKAYFGGNILGSHDGKKQENFCTLYQLITNMENLPKNMHEWFLSFSIRNKQTTIKPYFFKHIREYAKMDYWQNLPKIKTPDIQEAEVEITKKDPIEEFDSIL